VKKLQKMDAETLKAKRFEKYAHLGVFKS